MLIIPLIHAECGTTACSCGDSLNHSRNLDSSDDLTGCYRGLQIEQDNIVLDCKGQGITTHNSRNQGIHINAHNVTIKNCNIKGFYFGISTDNSSGLELINNTITRAYASGIYLKETHQSTIRKNHAGHNYHGIFLENATNNTIAYNTATFNEINGIQLSTGTMDNTVVDNNCTHNGGHGIAPITCNNEVSRSNLAGEGGPVLFWANEKGIRVVAEDSAEIIFCNVTESIIEDVNISNGKRKTDGIIFVDSHENIVRDSHFSSVRTGIYFINSSRNQILSNDFVNSDYGVRFVWNATQNMVRKNSFVDNERHFYSETPENSFEQNRVNGEIISFEYEPTATLLQKDEDLLFQNIEIKSTSNPFALLLLPLVMIIIAVIIHRLTK
ncbi:MAG: right-handed parallel beta-helix repeat-containing protein [Nanobdellota archaeon]